MTDAVQTRIEKAREIICNKLVNEMGASVTVDHVRGVALVRFDKSHNSGESPHETQ